MFSHSQSSIESNRGLDQESLFEPCIHYKYPPGSPHAEWLEPAGHVKITKGFNVRVTIGAGTGDFTWRLAKAVGPDGLVYAVDIQPEMIEKLTGNMKSRDLQHYRPIQGSARDPGIPELPLDLGLMVDVYHEFSHPAEMPASLGRALKPGGRLVLVEYREEDPFVPIKRLHKMSLKQVRKEAEASKLEYIETIDALPHQHVIVFHRPAS